MLDNYGGLTSLTKTVWYLDSEKYRWFLENVQISEEDYFRYINEVLEIFPIQFSQDYTQGVMKKEKGLYGTFSLHPVPFNVLKRHPVSTFMSGKVPDYHILAEIANLGKDLSVTKNILGIASVRRDLRILDQYIGRLFEIEILAAFTRANMNPEIMGTPDFRAMLAANPIYVEARHRGPPFAQAVHEGIMLGLAFKEFGDLSVSVGNVGSTGECVEQVAETVLNDIYEILGTKQTEPVTIKKQTYEISHDPSGGPRGFSFRYGQNSYDGDISNIIKYALKDKERQLNKVGSFKGYRVQALDLRSLFPALPPEEKREAIAPGWLNYYAPRIKKWRNSVLFVVHDFLNQSNTTDAVLIWWKNEKGVWPCNIREEFENRYTIQAISKQKDCVVEGGPDIQAGLEALLA